MNRIAFSPILATLSTGSTRASRYCCKALLRKYEKLARRNKIRSLMAIGYLRRYMADLSSEVRLARLAKEYGYEVKLGRRPDLFIDGKGIEVKRVRTRPVIHRLRKVPLASLSNPIRRGLKQKADVIAVQVNSLNKRKIKDFKTVWTATDTLKNVLERVLAFRKRRPVLLFCGTSRGYFARIVLVK